MTQSGETADTLAALASEAQGTPDIGLCNVVGISIAREADGGVYLHAGPEIGVASTKAFSNQVVVLAMLAVYFGRAASVLSGRNPHDRELKAMPDMMRRTLELPRTGETHRPQISPTAQLPLPRPAVSLSRWRWKGR